MDRNFTDTEEAEIAKIYLAGYSVKAIMRAYGFKYHISFSAALRRQGIEQRSLAERNRLYKVNTHAFDAIDNEHKAYWLGFLYADGCVYNRSVKLSLARKDRHHIKKFKLFLESEHPINDFVESQGHPQSSIFVTDEHLTDMLRKYGILKNRPDYKLAIDNIPENLHHHWLRGYFDGDGSARKSPSIVFCGQEDLLKWIRQFSANHANTNPNLVVTKHRTANIYYFHIGGRIQALNFAPVLYRNATVWLERKRNVINSWPQGLHSQQRGEGNWASKLTEKQVIEIRRGYVMKKTSYAKLGRKYNVSAGTITNIIKRKSWNYLK